MNLKENKNDITGRVLKGEQNHVEKRSENDGGETKEEGPNEWMKWTNLNNCA